MNITDMHAELDRAKDELLSLARAHNSRIPPAALTASTCAKLSGTLSTVRESLTVNSADSARAFVSGLDSGTRELLTSALRDVQTSERITSLVGEVRSILAKEAPGKLATLVVFATDDDENYNFLNQWGTVYFADGTTSKMDFGQTAFDVLRAEWDMVERKFTVGVNPDDGDVDEGINLWPRPR